MGENKKNNSVPDAAQNAGGKKSPFFAIMQSLSYLTQLGFSLVTPPLIFFFAAYYLQNRFDWGGWVWVAAVIFGFGGAAASFSNFAKFVKRKADKESQAPPTAFNK